MWIKLDALKTKNYKEQQKNLKNIEIDQKLTKTRSDYIPRKSENYKKCHINTPNFLINKYK